MDAREFELDATAEAVLRLASGSKNDQPLDAALLFSALLSAWANPTAQVPADGVFWAFWEAGWHPWFEKPAELWKNLSARRWITPMLSDADSESTALIEGLEGEVGSSVEAARRLIDSTGSSLVLDGPLLLAVLFSDPGALEKPLYRLDVDPGELGGRILDRLVTHYPEREALWDELLSSYERAQVEPGELLKRWQSSELLQAVKDYLSQCRRQLGERSPAEYLAEFESLDSQSKSPKTKSSRRLTKREGLIEGGKAGDPGVRDEDGSGITARAILHSDSWTLRDTIGTGSYAAAVANFIKAEDTRPPWVVGIQAPWGQGKTSMMRQIQYWLDPQHQDLRGLPTEALPIRAESGDHEADKAGDGEPQEAESEMKRPTIREAVAQKLPAKRAADNTDTRDNQSAGAGARDERDPCEEIEPPEETDYVTVWFNPWKYQNKDQVWAGLAAAILDQLTGRLSPAQREWFWLRLNLERLDVHQLRTRVHGALIGLAPVILGVACVVFLGLLAVWGSVAGSAAASLGLAGLGTFWKLREKYTEPVAAEFESAVSRPDYDGDAGALHRVDRDVRSIIELFTRRRQNATIVIFVDDLDRCSPQRVADVIEAVNLFLSGGFPGCAFVMGLDPAMVAAALEVANSKVIEKVKARGDEIGWRFMDKFVQLPLLVPRLRKKERLRYLESMLQSVEESKQMDKDEHGERRAGRNEIAERIKQLNVPEDTSFDPVEFNATAVAKIVKDVEEAESRVSSPEERESLERLRIEAQRVGLQAAEKAASDERALGLLKAQWQLLSGNPRSIKRIVNVFRLQLMISSSRAGNELPYASVEQVTRWSIAMARWQPLLRWLQRSDRGAERDSPNQNISGVTRYQELTRAARNSKSVDQFIARLQERGMKPVPSWLEDDELHAFLRSEEEGSPLSLEEGAARGWW